MESIRNRIDTDNKHVMSGGKEISNFTRCDLKEALNGGKPIDVCKGFGRAGEIPKGKFAAPNLKFAETDEAFCFIVTKNKEEILKLDKIGDINEFIRQSFELLKGEMGLNPDIELVITENDNHYDLKENAVYMSRNWAGLELKHVKGKGDKAEIFGGLVHELNHYLQRKEFILSYDTDNSFWIGLINILQKIPRARENIKYIANECNYPSNWNYYKDENALKEALARAKKYGENRKNYVRPDIREDYVVVNDDVYRGQILEKESFERGNKVVEEYKNVIGEQ